MNYVLVFDASVAPYRDLPILIPGLISIAVGAVMVAKPEWVEKVIRRPFKTRWFFRWFFLLFALFWTATAANSIVSDAHHAQRSLQHNDCEMVEGRVEHFHPMPAAGHDEESFDVNGVKFWYSDYIITGGFNNSASHGGPIREGLPVRICYRDSEILRLEVAR